MLALADSFGVQLEAWGPFAEAQNGIFSNHVLTAIANAHGRSVGQVILRWNIQRGVVVIPKSIHKERIKENIDIWDFSLTDGEMENISTIDTIKPLIFNYNTPEEVKRIYSIPCPD